MGSDQITRRNALRLLVLSTALTACSEGTQNNSRNLSTTSETKTHPTKGTSIIEYVSIEDAGRAHGEAPGAWWATTSTGDGITYRLILTDGDELFSAIERFAAAEKVTYADFSGIGAVRAPELGWFDRTKKQYRKNSFTGQFEAVGIIGNIGFNSQAKKPAAHTHLSVAGEDGTTYSGHLLSVIASPTIELNVHVFPGHKLAKATDSASGLSLYQK